MNDRKGFTLIEILGVISIIGVLAGIGITAVSSYIENSKRSTFVILAEEYLNAAKSLKATDTLVQEPKNGEALLIPLKMLEIDKSKGFVTPYGDIDEKRSYAIIVNENNSLTYYINFVDTEEHALLMETYNGLKKENIKVGNIDSPDHNKLKKGIITNSIEIKNVVYNLSSRDYKVIGADNNYVTDTILLEKA